MSVLWSKVTTRGLCCLKSSRISTSATLSGSWSVQSFEWKYTVNSVYTFEYMIPIQQIGKPVHLLQ
ncbi:hypothetical protein Plhal304r1_c025g0085381 [Plasmopara halstedii]